MKRICSTKDIQTMCVGLVYINRTPIYLIDREPRLKPKRVYKEVLSSSSTLDKKTWLFSEFVTSLDNPVKSSKALFIILTESMST